MDPGVASPSVDGASGDESTATAHGGDAATHSGGGAAAAVDTGWGACGLGVCVLGHPHPWPYKCQGLADLGREPIPIGVQLDSYSG